MFYSSLWLRSNWRKILDVLGEEKKNERKKGRKKDLSPFEGEGGRGKERMYVCACSCVHERERERQS